MKDHEHTPQHEELQKKNALEAAEVQEVLRFIKRYGKPAGAGLCAVLLAILVINGYAQYKTSRETKAAQLLRAATTPQQLEEVADKYGSTLSAPVALLNLAKNYFNDGEIAQARTQYERFLKQYKKHEMSSTAEIGLAYCTEADGNFSDAAEQFNAFTLKHTASYLRPQAILSVARCLKQAGKPDEARVVLEDFLAGNIGTQWANDAEAALQNLGKK